MRGSLRKFYLGAILCSLTGVAGAAPLTVVTVAAPDINCVFETDCTVVVTDSVGNIALPSATGIARLQSRTFAGQPGAPGAGKTGYEYRLDLTQATAIGDVACVNGIAFPYLEVEPRKYRFRLLNASNSRFLAAVGAGDRSAVACTPADALATLRVALAGEEALAPGRTVVVS